MSRFHDPSSCYSRTEEQKRDGTTCVYCRTIVDDPVQQAYEAIVIEIRRQAGEDRYDAPYLYGESDEPVIGIDGCVDLRKIAEAVVDVLK